MEPDTPRDQGNVLDCTGCWITQVLFIFTELLWDHTFLSHVTKTRVSDYTGSTVFHMMQCPLFHIVPNHCQQGQRKA